MTGRFFNGSLMGSISLISLIATGAAQAQQVSDSDTPIEEIVVTAQKRAESARDVPITLTAYTGDFLEEIGVDELDELSEFVPGLNIQLQSPNNPAFVIRGITSDEGSFQVSQRVSVFLNGVDVSRSRGSAFEIYDIERVEVIKGPQATLFGSAAAIGAISIITAKPEQEVSGSFYGGYGNLDQIKLGGYVTGGTDILQGRFSWQYRRRDGIVENIADQKDLSGIDTFAVRPSLRFTPSERFTADLVFNYESNNPPGTAFKSAVVAPSGGDTSPFTFAELPGAFGRNATIGQQELGGNELGLEREIYDINLTASYDISDILTITSVTAYREFDSLEIFDADGFQAPLFEFNEDSEGEQFSQELRFTFDNGGRLRGFAGLNYFEEKGFQDVSILLDELVFLACAGIDPTSGESTILPSCTNADGSVNAVDLARIQNSLFNTADLFELLPLLATGQFPLSPIGEQNPLPTTGQFRNSADNQRFSAFLDFTFEATEALELTAGLRYLYEDKTSGFSSVFPRSQFFDELRGFFATLEGSGALPPGALPPGIGDSLPTILLPFIGTEGELVEASDDFDAFLPRFNARWAVNDDLNLYATVAKGRTSPVINISQGSLATGDPAPISFIPAERIWNYEAGFKGLFLDGTLDLEGAVFYQDYSNFQILVSIPGSGLVTFETTGSARNVGVEGAFRYQATDALRLFGNFAYIDAKIGNNPDANGDFAGNRFRLQPKFSSSAGATYTQDITDVGKFFATATWTWKTDVFFEETNAPIAGVPIREGDVHQVDLRAGLIFGDGRYELTGFVNNVFDEDFVIDGGNIGGTLGTPTFIAGPPRLYGFEGRIRF